MFNQREHCRNYTILKLNAARHRAKMVSMGKYATWKIEETIELDLKDEKPGNDSRRPSKEDQILEDLLEKALAHCLQRNYEEAIKFYTSAMQYHPSYAPLYKKRGACYSRLQLYEEARVDTEKALLLDPSYAKGYRRLMISNLLTYRWTECDTLATKIKDLPAAMDVDVSLEIEQLQCLREVTPERRESLIFEWA